MTPAIEKFRFFSAKRIIFIIYFTSEQKLIVEPRNQPEIYTDIIREIILNAIDHSKSIIYRQIVVRYIEN